MSSTPLKESRGVALITGAAGGIGRGLSQAFANAGYSLALNDIAESALDQLKKQLQAQGFDIGAYITDITNGPEVQRMVAQIEEERGPITVLVNNAAIFSPAPLLEITDEEWDAVQSVNVKGVLHCAQAVAPYMAKRGGGAIVNLASLAGKRGRTIFGKPGESTWAAYAVSKAGVTALTQAMAYEWAPSNIRVNAVAPGPILTGFHDEAKLARAQEVPVNRIGTPEDVARAALFLCSEENSFVQGEVVDVNGGLAMD